MRDRAAIRGRKVVTCVYIRASELHSSLWNAVLTINFRLNLFRVFSKYFLQVRANLKLMSRTTRQLNWSPFGNTRYLCPAVDQDNSLPVWRAVHVVGVYTCACSDNCQHGSELVSVQVIGSEAAPFRFPFSQLLRYDEELVDTDVWVR